MFYSFKTHTHAFVKHSHEMFFLDKGCYDIVKKHLNKKATGLQLQLGHLENKTERKLK